MAKNVKCFVLKINELRCCAQILVFPNNDVIVMFFREASSKSGLWLKLASLK